MTLRQYFDSLKSKTVAVIGIGVSNTPLLRLLLREGICVTACDKRERSALGELADELEKGGCRLQLGADYLHGLHEDVIFRTPGLRPDVPELLQAQQQGSELTSEMEVFFSVCPCTLIAVTGSDGKTTTTTIIAELLKAAGKTVHVGGNIGNPLLCQADEMRPEDYAVLELSSFQLMTMRQSPHIAVVTNLAPNHLDMHKDMAEYVAAKENIFRYQKAGDIAVFNLDNDITREQAERAVGRVRTFSRRQEPTDGVFLRGESIISSQNGQERVVMQTQDIRLPGVHNVENYMAAIAAVDGLVPDEVIRDFARSFNGVEHRIELVRVKDGIKFYNDSIASSPSRTIAGLRSFPEKVILIAGGYDKHIPYDVLGPEICAHVKKLFLGGATGEKIRQAVISCPEYDPESLEIVECGAFEPAVRAAAAAAKEGDVVLMSPASAAFDQFKNFMVRGEFYKKLVKEL